MSNEMTDVLDDIAERIEQATPTASEVDKLLVAAEEYKVPLAAIDHMGKLIRKFKDLTYHVELARKDLADVSKKRT